MHYKKCVAPEQLPLPYDKGEDILEYHRFTAYGLLVTGAIASLGSLRKRRAWETANHHAGIMLDWDDVQAVATRAVAGRASPGDPAGLLRRLKSSGATHLSIPELSLNRLLARGQLSLTQGSSARRVYLKARDVPTAELVAAELAIRLPQIEASCSGSPTPVISFIGDLPSVAEVGLGFDPAHASLAREVGLGPVARPIGYSWVQPEMIERTLDQAAALGAKIIAVQGNLIPGHEFKLQHTVAAMQRNRLILAYFSQSRHQKGDWFLAKSLAPAGQVILAHEFQPDELLEEEWHTISRRWANLAIEAGIRLCSVRFFRVLHAADPLEALAYVQELARALMQAGLKLEPAAGEIDHSLLLPERDELSLAAAGLSIAGAAGLAADLLPLPEGWKLAGTGVGALALGGLPFLEKAMAGRRQSQAGDHDHSHDHDQDHDHHHHDHDDHDHHHHDHDDHDHAHHSHDHAHDHHHHDHDHPHSHGPETAYAPKGLALAASVAYPAAALALPAILPPVALAHSALVGAAGAAALSATGAERDYLLDIEGYRGYHLDWLLPLGLAAGSALRNRGSRPGWLAWLPLAGVGFAALWSLLGRPGQDIPASLDREHRYAHTHHLSAFQRAVGDTKMALSARPLRKWSLLAPLGTVGAALLRRQRQPDAAAALLTAAAAGQVATLAGFRNGQRPLPRTAAGRAGGWSMGMLLAGLAWLCWRFLVGNNE